MKELIHNVTVDDDGLNGLKVQGLVKCGIIMQSFIFSITICMLLWNTTVAQTPLYIPPALSGTTFDLSVQSGTTQIYAGINTPTFGINGSFLAPTLVLKKGEVVTMNVTNNLTTETTMHWHGLHVPAHADGGPHQIIEEGTTWSPEFTVMNDAGTYWYHPHGAHKTDLQVSKGLAGMIIVQDEVEAALVLPRTYGVDDFPLIVQTKSFDILHQIAIATVYDTVPMVNGIRDPYLDVPAQVVRFRLLNGSSDRTFLFGFSNNMNFYKIASDAGLLSQPVMMNRLQLSNGERAEILVDLSAMQGQTVFLKSFGSELTAGIIGAEDVGMGMMQIPEYDLNFLNGADFNLLQVNISAPTSNPVTTIPATLVTLVPWSESQATKTRTITLAPQSMGMENMVVGPFTINGTQFDMDVIDLTTYLNTTEIWTLDNQTMVAHPFHIHDMHFFILDVNGGPVPVNFQGKKDVALVMPMQTLRFITRFEDFADTIPYMYHCHLLHHEDDGMMGSFVVLDSSQSGVHAPQSIPSISVYPNPATNLVTVSNLQHGKNYTIRIINTLGQIVFQTTNTKGSHTEIDVSRMHPGMYLLNTIDGDGKVQGAKFEVLY